MSNHSLKVVFLLFICYFLSSSVNGQDDCVPTTGIVTPRFNEVIINYGSTTNAVNTRRASSMIIGEPLVGQSNNTKNTSEFGFYSQFLLPPQSPFVSASQGELLDRIQITWTSNALGGTSTGGFNIYRDGIFLDNVGPNISSYNDFNVIAGRPYTYTIAGINDFGEGFLGSGLGFMVPNGVVTGQIETPTGNPVVNATVSLDPMQGFATSFGSQHGAGALQNASKPFLPNASSDWTISFWIKTTASAENGSIMQIGPNIGTFIRFVGIQSSTGSEGVIFSFENETLDGIFPNESKNDWHHITLTHKASGFLTSLFIDGVLAQQKAINIPTISGSLDIGNRFLAGGWNGKMDELRFYHRALNEVEIEEAMENTVSTDTPNLAYYWKMDEELGNKCFDNVNRHPLYLCGATFDSDKPKVRTAGRSNEDGYYKIEGVSYGTGTTFLATPAKNFYSKRSLQFSSENNDWVKLPSFPLANQSTMELWFNSSNNPNSQSLVSKKFGSDEFKVSVIPSGNAKILQISTNGGTPVQTTPISNGYNHLALILDDSNLNVYLNGNTVGSGQIDVAAINDTTYQWILGASENGTSSFFDGYIDEIAVYDTLLSMASIQDHFINTRSVTESNLTVYFPLDEGSGNFIGSTGSILLPSGQINGPEWSTFAPLQETTPHEFTPKTRQVTLNPSVTSVDQVDFTDRSTIPISGYVRYKNTDCFQPKVEILVNGESFSPKVFTNEEGKFVVDFDPGTTAVLSPKYEDHIYSPSSWEVINVTTPIAGILFNNTVSRKVTGQVAGGDCRQSIIKDPGLPTGTVCTVKLRTADGCFEQLQTINNVGTGLDEGDYEFLTLPPFENLIVSIIEHSDPLVKNYFQALGGSTVDLKAKDTIIDFIYHSEPKIEIVSGLEPYSPSCDVIVMAQFDLETIGIKLKEEYLDGNSCYIDSANFRIINELSGGSTDTSLTSSNGILNYKFKVGAPNPSAPHTKTLQIVATTLDGNDTEFTTSAIITGVRAKQNSFTSTMPETPFIVLRDPPGDGSYATIEKGETFCRNLSSFAFNSNGAGINVVTDFAPDVKISTFFGVADVEFGGVAGPDFTALVTKEKVNERTTEYCLTSTQKFSTSDGDLVTGPHGGDLFIGGALNVEFGFVDVVKFDSTLCEAFDSLAINFGAKDFATTFMYSEYYIRNTVLYQLEELKNNVPPADTLLYFNSIKNWNKILNDNATLKKNAKVVRNISVAAGAVYESSMTIDTTVVNYTESSVNSQEDLKIVAEFSFNGVGGGVNLLSEFQQVSGSGKGSTNSNEITTSYVISDNDELDAFSIDIAEDPVYKTPVFKVKAGQSSCPWEPGTAKREGVYLESVDGPFRTDVPADQPAVYKFLLHNTSATNETWTYAFTAGPESNPHSAKIFCNGAPMNQIQWYAIPWGTTIPVTVTLERGPVEYDYNDLEIVLYSACEDQRANDLGILPDTAVNLYSAVYISANFIRPCSEVKINVPEQDWVVFPDPLTAGNDDIRRITVSGYDTTATDFQLIRLQYRRSNGDGAWINILPQAGTSFEAYNGNWSGFDDLPAPKPPKLQPIFTQFFWNTEGLADGDYEIRAVTICTGDAANRPGASETIRGRIDREPPKLLGLPQPSDGVYHVGDEVSFTFNQDINCNKLIQADIFNENNVGLYDATTNDLIDCEISCSGNKIILVPNFENRFFENRILRAELHNIEDLTGNKNVYQEWEFYVDRNELAWLDDTVQIVKYPDETKNVKVEIHNRGGYPVPFKIIAPDHLNVSPNQGTLVANETEEISFTVNDNVSIGNYMDSVVLVTETGINPFFMGGEEVLMVNTRVICRPPVWVIDPGSFDNSQYDFSMNFIVRLNIEGTLSEDTEDLVGAYVNGQLRGVAKVVFRPGIGYVAFLTAYSNSVSGETVDFQIWDASECELYANIIESFPFNDNSIIGTLPNPQVLRTSGQILRKIYLHPGWNWISINQDLTNPAINSAMSSLTNPAGGTIKTQSRFSQYSTAIQQWVGSLNNVSPQFLYQYNGLAYDSLSLIGNQLSANTTIPIVPGWNWIGYLPNIKLPVNDALSSMTPQDGDIIKSQMEFAVYNSALGWVGSLEFMSPPNGYLLKSAENDVILYPNINNFGSGGTENGLKSIDQGSDRSYTDLDRKSVKNRSQKWNVDPSKYEYTMNAIAIVTKGNGDNILKEGDEVGVFVDDEIRGCGKAIFIPELNAYMMFITIYANKEGEKLEFKYLDASDSEEFSLINVKDFKINSIWGSVDVPQPLQLGVSTSTDAEFNSTQSAFVHPNPFNHTTYINFNSINSGTGKLNIVDMLGIMVASYDIEITTGRNSIEWKPDNRFVPGPYFIRVESDDNTIVKKVFYLK